MDQMIAQITECAKKHRQFSEDEVQSLAQYLMGSIPFEQVAGLLPSTGEFSYGFYTSTDEIALACKNEPALLPRLGRYLNVIRAMNTYIYSRLAEMLARTLPVECVFLDSGLGVAALLDHLFARGSSVEDGTNRVLELVCGQYWEDLEAWLMGAQTVARIRPLAYVCARKGLEPDFSVKPRLFGKPLPMLLGSDLLSAFSVLVNSWGGKAPKRFRAALEELCPKALLSWTAKELAAYVGDNKGKQVELFRYNLFLALHMSDYKIKGFNLLCQAAAKADSNRFANLCVWARERLTDGIHLSNEGVNNSGFWQKQKITGEIAASLEIQKEIFDRMGVPQASLCAWAANKTLSGLAGWREGFVQAFGQEKALLLEAVELVSPWVRPYLYRYLVPLGEPYPAQACGQLALDSFCKRMKDEKDRKGAQKLASWLTTGQGDVTELPGMANWFGQPSKYTYNTRLQLEFDLAVWSMVGYSRMPDRYAGYLSAHGHWRHLELAAGFLTYECGYKADAVAAYMVENGACAGCTAGFAFFIGSDGAFHKELLRSILGELVAAQPQEAAAQLSGGALDADTRLCLVDTLYERVGDYDPDFLVSLLGDKSKKVRQHALSFLLPKKELLEKVRPLCEARKKDVREAAQQLVAAYEGGAAGDGGDMDVLALCARTLPKNGLNAIRWAIPGDLPAVRKQDGSGPAEEQVVGCYLYLMLTAKEMALNPVALTIRAALNEDDLREVARSVYEQWLSDGAPAKYKAALLLYGLHAGDTDVIALQRQIEEWAQRSRGAIAAEAVRAMAMGAGDLALMTVDNIGRKIKNKQVRRAAQESFHAVAQAMGTTVEALGDRIIPTLGFDGRGERVVDYGNRQFTAILSPSLTITLQDATGKTIKSLPKPGAKDDTEKAEKAKAEFTALKKSLKAVVTTQTSRLEQALATGRQWDREAWEKLFVENPIMHCFAIGLIWGVYSGDKLVQTFRYLEDGGFTDSNEDDFDLAGIGEGSIGLVHPLELAGEELETWREQLSDYEITQPVLQVDRPLYTLEEAERGAIALERFGGKKMPGITMINRLQKLGWYKGSVQDAGCFTTFYKEVGQVGIQLYFTYLYVSPDPSETTTIGQAGFYRAGSVNRGSYVYDDVTKEEIIPLAEVSPRLFSETVYELTLTTASSTETDGHWRSDRSLLFFDGK